MEHYKFCQNPNCEFFPCHQGVKEEDFNCLFCYCPLYALGENCGGNPCYTESGIKDCSNCLKPHRAENYDKIMEQMLDVMKLAKKQTPPKDMP